MVALGVSNRGKRITIGAGISNRGKEISSSGRYYKSGQDRLQTGVGISNRGRDYKSVQNKCKHD